MSMASAAPFSGLSRPANSTPGPAVPDQAMSRTGGYGGRTASTGTTRRHAPARPRARSDTNACEPPRCGSRMAVTSGAMIAIFTLSPSLGKHLTGQVARRVDAQDLEGNARSATPPYLGGRLGVEDLGQLHRL